MTLFCADLDDLSPVTEYELSDMLAPLPRDGSERWMKSPPICDDKSLDNSVLVKAGKPRTNGKPCAIGAIKPTDVTHNVEHNTTQHHTGNQSDITINNRTRPPLLHTKAIILDDDNLPKSPPEDKCGQSTGNHFTPLIKSGSVDDEIIITTLPSTHKTQLPVSKQYLSQYEMSYEKFLEKGIEVWKDVQNQKESFGVVDGRTMSALTIVT